MSGYVEEPSALDVNTTGSNARIDQDYDDSRLPVTASAMADAQALLYTHPDYDATNKKWAKYIDCYRANDIYRFIHQHPREHDDVFQMRVQRGYYFNYVSSIVDLYVAYLFEAGVTRSPGESKNDVKKILDEFYVDSDFCGTNYHLFVQMAATFAICCGHVGVLVDMPTKPDGGIRNELERKRAKHRPYLTMVQASQIMDWELDDTGNFEWVKIELAKPQGRQWKETVDDRTRDFVIWSKTNWERWQYRNELRGTDGDEGIVQEVEIAEMVRGDHKLGKVPLVIIRNNQDLAHSWFGESAVRDICDINLAILNWCSFADEEIANRCLNILTMQRDENDKEVQISHYNVLEYAEGANEPAYLTPGDTPLKLIWEAIDQARNEIYRLAKLSGSTGLLGVREATSGIAYAFEFNETNQSLCKKAEFLEQAEKEIHKLVGLWLSQDFEGDIIYPREFGVDDFLMELQILAEARTSLTSETAIKEVEKAVVAKMFAKKKQELRDKVLAEIEEADPKPAQGMFEGFETAPKELTKDPDKPNANGSASTATTAATK